MPNHLFEQLILNSPYAYPGRHWEFDPDGQPTDKITAEFSNQAARPSLSTT